LVSGETGFFEEGGRVLEPRTGTMMSIDKQYTDLFSWRFFKLFMCNIMSISKGRFEACTVLAE